MSPNHPRTRFAAHPETLGRLVTQLGGKSAVPRSEIAGQLLTVAGDLLRRTKSLKPDAATIDAALKSVTAEDVSAWHHRPGLHDWTVSMERAADEAIESILPDTFDEAPTWRQWAMEGLKTRDALQSALAALDRIDISGGSFAGDVRRDVLAELSEHDRALRVKARWWVALNEDRRAERDLLDAAGRSECWWFSARADCDDLLALLSGEKTESPHLSSCSECQRDLALTRPVQVRRTRHLNAENLWRYDLNLATAAERTFAEMHSRGCADCAQALRALSLDEEEPLPGPSGVGLSTATVASSPQRARRSEVEVLDERDDFRLVLQRRKHRVRLLIQIRREGRVAAAAVFLPASPALALKPVHSAEGLEFDLGDESELLGTHATINVDLPGQPRYERSIDL